MNRMAQDSFTQNYREYSNRLSRYLKRRGVDPIDREDIIQEAFLRCLSSLKKGDASIALLIRAARNIHIDLYRKRKGRNEEADEACIQDIAEDIGSQIVCRQKVMISQLLEAQELTGRSRFFRMHFDQELGIAEIARITGTAQGTVASQITRYKMQFYKFAKESLEVLDSQEA